MREPVEFVRYLTYAGRKGALLRLEGPWDASPHSLVLESIREALDDGCTFLVVDVSGCPWINESSVGFFIRIVNECFGGKRGLILLDTGGGVSDVFQLLGIETLLPIIKSLDQVGASLDGR